MTERLKELKERSQKRRLLLAQQLGLSGPDSLREALNSREEQEEKDSVKQKTAAGGDATSPKKQANEEDIGCVDTSKGVAWVAPNIDHNEDDEEETVYTDSSAFLKGTQSANPHNDYCQNFVDTGERPQNYIRDVGLANRFEEYPKLRELIRLKDELIRTTNVPPMYLKCDLENYDLADLDAKFDVILVEPPLEEYQRTQGVNREKYWSWDEIEKLEIDQVAARRSFLWIWCGSSDGLDAGRRCLKKWGFRRCEDICWIKTNIKNPGHNKNLEPNAIFQRSKEHCLMGIKGTVKRSTDGDFIHANVDIDIIIDEEKEYGSMEKPIEIFHLIEHFCLGRRRLHLFGRDSTIRPGWVTVSPDLTSSNYDPVSYNNFFDSNPDSYLTGCPEEIERLRPKSPPPKEGGGRGGRGGRGGNMSNRGGQSGRGGGQWGGQGGQQRGGFRGRGRGGMQQH